MLQAQPVDPTDVINIVISNVVSDLVFGETFRAIASLQEESFAVGDVGESRLQVAGLTCKYQRRKGRQALFDFLQLLEIRILRHLQDWRGR